MCIHCGHHYNQWCWKMFRDRAAGIEVVHSVAVAAVMATPPLASKKDNIKP